MRREFLFKVWSARVLTLARGFLVALYLHREWRSEIRPKRVRRWVPPGRPLRVALVTEYYHPVLGGITEHVHHFAQYLLLYGHEVAIFTPVVGTFHTHFEENFWMSLLHRYLRPYLEALSLCIAVSPACVHSLERYFPDLPLCGYS